MQWRSLGVNSFLRLAGAILQLGLAIVVARLLTIEDAGVYFVAVGIATLAATFARLGAEISVLRDLAITWSRDRARAGVEVWPRLAGSAAASVAVSALVLVGLVILGSRVLPVEVWLPTLAAIPGIAVGALIGEAFKAIGRPGVGIVTQSVVVPIAVGAAIIVSAALVPITAVLVVSFFSLANGIVAIGGLVIAGAVGMLTRGTVTEFSERTRHVFRSAPGLLAISAVPPIMQWLVPVGLALALPAGDVAGYSVASRVAVMAGVVHSAVTSVLGPRIAVAVERHDPDSLKRLAHRASIMVTVLLAPALLLVIIFAPWVMSVFSADYVPFGDVLRIMAAAQLIACPIMHSGLILTMAGEYRLARVGTLLPVVVLIVGIVPLVTIWGVLGGAAVYALALVSGHLAATGLVRRRLSIWALPTRLSDIRSAREGWGGA